MCRYQEESDSQHRFGSKDPLSCKAIIEKLTAIVDTLFLLQQAVIMTKRTTGYGSNDVATFVTKECRVHNKIFGYFLINHTHPDPSLLLHSYGSSVFDKIYYQPPSSESISETLHYPAEGTIIKAK